MTEDLEDLQDPVLAAVPDAVAPVNQIDADPMQSMGSSGVGIGGLQP